MLFPNFRIISIIGAISISILFSPAFALTEAVDLFGEINSADLILNDIWINPENPKEGEPVSIHASIYNAGVIETGDISDAVTMAFIVNGEIVEINLLESILPGTENGIHISSGTVFGATSGDYIITGIVNYHDTLSHLRDNPENNIVQKKYRIGESQPVVITSEILQSYDQSTETQTITINGHLNNFFQERLANQDITISIPNFVDEQITTDNEGMFSIVTQIPFLNEVLEVKINLEDNSDSFPQIQKIYPIKLNQNESIMTFEIFSDSPLINFEDSEFTIVIFQDTYENLLKKVNTNEINENNLLLKKEFSTVLPSDHEYIVEIYYEGRFLDAFQSFAKENATIKKDIFIPEKGQIKFKVTDENNEPQRNVVIENWIYSGVTDENGTTEWIEILPTIIPNEPYAAKATFHDKSITWSESFLLESGEKKIISIIKGMKSQ